MLREGTILLWFVVAVCLCSKTPAKWPILFGNTPRLFAWLLPIGVYELKLTGSGKPTGGGHFHADGTLHADGTPEPGSKK